MINETDLEAWGYYKDSTLYKDMTLSSYQKAAAGTAIYETQHAIIYPALGLAGEAGEVAEKIKKMLRDSNRISSDEIVKELGDVVFYATAIANYFNSDLTEVLQVNMEKLNSRAKRGVIKGSGDNR